MPDPSPVAASGRFLFTSEAVSEGHPDKMCDRVSDAVLDSCLASDPEAKVSCEACTKSNMVMILGEAVTKASVNYEQVIREAVKSVGYDSEEKGLDWRTMNVIVAIEDQTPDLAQAITVGKAVEDVGLGDLGTVFGYATDESPTMMPLSHVLASKLCMQLDRMRREGTIDWARPAGRAQVTIEYRETPEGAVVPVQVRTVVMSVQQSTEVKAEQVEKDLMEHVVKPVLPAELCDASTVYSLLGCKHSGGILHTDTGLTGRKNIADTYGGWGSHGGMSMSGKDASRVCRSATYGARWAARSLVAARFCKRCQVQLTYIPSSTQPTAISVNSYGTAKSCGKTDSELGAIIARNFDFRPGCLQRDLGLKSPIFQKLAAYGHLGRTDIELAWEKPKELH